MAAVNDSRNIIQIEDVQFRSSVSEAVGTKLAGTLNFISNRQNDKHSWHLNGPYRLGVGSTGTDGVFPCLFNMAITGFSYYSGESGTSGTTTVDVHLLDGDGVDSGSIFITKPSVDSTSLDNSTTVYDVLNSTAVTSPVGHTLAVLNQTVFNAGDVLRLDLDGGMVGGSDFQFIIFFRPI